MTAPRVLLTGCAGYIGSVLTRHLLHAGCKVIGVDSLMYDNASALLPYLGDPNFEFHRYNLADSVVMPRLLKRADVVMPLAAFVGAPLCDKSPIAAVSVNYQAVRMLVGSSSKEQRFIYPNTNSGYGQTDGNSYCTEDDRLSPVSHYGQTKCEGEKVILDHPNGVSLRLATVFGVSPRMRMDLMANDFTERVYRTRRLQLYEPHFKRNFVGVQDVARAFLFMAGRGWLKGAFNLGLPTANLTKLELAHKVCDLLRCPRSNVVIGDGQDPDKRNYLVSNDKILRSGFQFKHELQAGILEVANLCMLFNSDQTRRMRNS